MEATRNQMSTLAFRVPRHVLHRVKAEAAEKGVLTSEWLRHVVENALSGPAAEGRSPGTRDE